MDVHVGALTMTIAAPGSLIGFRRATLRLGSAFGLAVSQDRFDQGG